MLPDRVFMWILCGIYTMYTILRIYYRRLANRVRNHVEFSERKEGIDLLNYLIWFEVITFFLYVGWTILDPESVPFRLFRGVSVDGLRWTGLGCGILALGLFWWSHQSLGSNFSPNIKIRQHQQLVTNGPYHYIRHPMYTAFYFLHASVFLLSLNYFFGVMWFAGLTGIMIYRIPREEKLMAMKFGDLYLKYQQRTRRFLPGLF